jgi:hypothetical protein
MRWITSGFAAGASLNEGRFTAYYDRKGEVP